MASKTRIVAVSTNGWAAIHYAAKRGDVKILNVLIQHGGDVHLRADDGKIPLHLAVMYNNEEAINLLLERGSDVNAKDNFGNTALSIALGRINSDVSLV